MPEQQTIRDLCQTRGQDKTYSFSTSAAESHPAELRVTIRALAFSSHLAVEHKGCTTWPSAELLAQLLARRLPLRPPPAPRIIELGCGAGPLPGLVAAGLGASVLLTDLPDIVPLAQDSVELSGLTAAAVRPLAWGAQAAALGETFDVILAADVLYDPSLHTALAETLEIVAAPGALALVAVQGRSDSGDGRAFAFFSDVLPQHGWDSRRLELSDVFQAMSSSQGYRETFSVWACWRAGDGQPSGWYGDDAAHGRRQTDEGAARDSDSDDPPLAPPEVSEDSDSEPALAPPESD